jgi:Zn-dependent protease with chaperone function
MTQEQFDAFVARLEGDAKRDPAAYKQKVLLLGLLGYGYVFFILALVLALALAIVLLLLTARRGGSAALRLAIPLLALGYLILRSLWVRLAPPEGLSLAARAPALFAEIANIRRALRGPRVHEVLLTDEFNAGIVQIPRLGLFGWQKNYLLVGLPMMQALSPQQFRAVLAHEFGHLSGAHGRTGAWIYRARKSWYQLMQNLDQQQHWGVIIFRRFFQWYAPFFGAYSFVLARAQEYEADRAAAELVGAEHAADALVATSAAGAFLSEAFWPGIYKDANQQAEPPASPYSEMQRSFQAGIAPELAQGWVAQALQAQTGSVDTHPSLADRLAALGQPVRQPVPLAETAAQAMLGADLEILRTQLDQTWRVQIAQPWQKRYAEVQARRQQLGELEAQAERAPLTPGQRWLHARLVEEFRGEEVALPLYQAILAEQPEDSGALFAAGRIRIGQQDADGIAQIEAAMRIDTDAILPGCQLVYVFLIEQGREQEAQEYHKRAVDWSQLLEEARAERAQLGLKDTYLPHGLSEAQIAQLKAQWAKYPEVAQAYLVRKQLKHFPEQPLYALGVVARRKAWYQARTPKDDAQLAQQLARLRFAGETFVVILNANNAKMKQIMEQTPGSRL